MTTQRPSDRPYRLAQQPSHVDIELRVQRDRDGFRDRIREIASQRHRIVIAVLVAAVVVFAIGAITSAHRVNETSTAPRHTDARASERGAAGVAAAYGHPLRCLSITTAPHDPAYARADFNHAIPCGRYGGYATAIFHWTGGSWRSVLYSLHYACPVAGLPSAVQVNLGVCP